jgi:xanthine dehydrogenase/oxidase
VSFQLNGQPVVIEHPGPDLLLIDYLRSPDVALTGAKKGCGQGGCGACTVLVSRWDEEAGRAEHRAVNSCLKPVCALDGLSVTTIEGTGVASRPAPANQAHHPSFSRSAAPPTHVPPALAEAAQRSVDERAGETGGMNPVAHRLAVNNGTQCGYCTTGFVMNMCAFLENQPHPTKREIEDVFDGNLCRCTGYRPILTGMKTFARDWTAQDEKRRMKCLDEDALRAQPPATRTAIAVPPAVVRQPVHSNGSGRSWLTPTSLAELGQLMRDHHGEGLRLVAANTSFGVYPDEVRRAQVLVDLRLVKDLYRTAVDENWVELGGGTTYTDAIAVLDRVTGQRHDGPTSALSALRFMARRTAGTIVRNAATLAGNTMLVLTHIHAGEPFPSDLLTALVAVDAQVTVWWAGTQKPEQLTVADLVDRAVREPAILAELVILRYHLPVGAKGDIVLAQKVALRDVNAHSLVNATTRLHLDGDLTPVTVALAYGGIAPYPWRATNTEKALRGGPLRLDGFPRLSQVLRDEVAAELERWRARMAEVPWEGVTDEYRIELATSLLYKAIVNALVASAPHTVPEEIRSAGEITWGEWPVSDGVQSYQIQDWKAPVSQPYIKLMAAYQATGQVHYTHELPVPPNTVNAAFVQSRRALAEYRFAVPGRSGPVDRDELRRYLAERFPGFVDLVTHEDVPNGGVNYQGMGLDQPMFAVDRVSYVGQAIALVVAGTEQEAAAIADHVADACLTYLPVDWHAPWNHPVLTLEEAVERGSVFPDYPASANFNSHIWRITRPGSEFGWTTADKQPLDRGIVQRKTTVDGTLCTVVENTQRTGGQAHFYMETQACVVEPVDGDRWLIRTSTQSPMEMHQTAAMALGVEYHRVEVNVPQVGGAYGGKTEQTRFVVGPAVVAAQTVGRPLRLVLPRDRDTSQIGKRHAVYGQYQVAIDSTGLIHGLRARMWADGGAFYDCSFIVTNCIQLRADNAYRIRNFQNQIDVCRTNTAPSTAFRGFGDIQGKLVIENAIDDAAFAVGLDAATVRERNLYDRGDVTPFGQALSYCYMKDVWAYLQGQARYAERKRAVEEFNRANRWRKRGLAMLPVKYGSGYNLTQLEQAVAYLSVYAGDGSVVIHQGGVDMGQGLFTKVEQVASYVLNLPFDLLRVDGPDTGVIPNPTSTGASTGTPYACEAVKRACQQLRERMTEFGYRMLRDNGPQWCADRQIDFWNHAAKGWATPVTGPAGTTRLIWQNLVQVAYQQRESLVVSFTAPIRGGETPVPCLEFKPMAEQHDIPGIEVDRHATPGGAVDSFSGFTYSAACSTVEVDILTGEVKILSADIAYDIGWSLNPALDVGQVEGAFVQGIGYVLTEQLVFEPDGAERGRLNTVNTWRYKPPAVTTIPLEFNTHLFPRDLASSVPDNPADLLSSKEVGEPPLVLATSVFLAVKAAIRASRLERGLDGLFPFDAPATVQEVQRACAVSLAQHGAPISNA